ncbi:hypothetical protein Gromo_00341 [Candidatus Gromoviella agglomerans]|nr:hypothetical protein Gromo_00341 [Candidatus Gromoviella agglomerans]
MLMSSISAAKNIHSSDLNIFLHIFGQGTSFGMMIILIASVFFNKMFMVILAIALIILPISSSYIAKILQNKHKFNKF